METLSHSKLPPLPPDPIFKGQELNSLCKFIKSNSFSHLHPNPVHTQRRCCLSSLRLLLRGHKRQDICGPLCHGSSCSRRWRCARPINTLRLEGYHGEAECVSSTVWSSSGLALRSIRPYRRYQYGRVCN